MKTRSTLTILWLTALLGVSALVALAAPTDDPSAPAVLAAPRDVCLSGQSGNWSSNSTWSTCDSDGIPDGDDIVIINNGHTVTLDSGGGAAYQLIVGGGTSGTLTHDTGSQTLLAGAGGVSVSNGATFNAPENVIIYTGAGLTVNGTFNGGSGNIQVDGDVNISSYGTLTSPSGTLMISGNFTNNGTFNHNNGTLAMSDSVVKSIGGSNLTFYNLTINNSAGVNLTSNATVNGMLTLNYDLNVGSGYALTMGGSATTQGNADVVGVTYRSSLGTGTGYTFGSTYTVITFTNGTPPTNLSVQLFKSAPGGLANAVQRYYSITPTGGSGYTFDLQLHYLDSELNGTTEGNLQMWQQVNGRWTLRSVTSRDTSNNWVQKTGLNSFSLWSLSDSGAPTAVTLSTFEARADAPSALPFIGLGALAVVMLGVVVWRRTMSQ